MSDMMMLITCFVAAMTAAACGIIAAPIIKADRPLTVLERKLNVDARNPKELEMAKAARLGVQLSALAAVIYILALYAQHYWA